MKKIITIVLAVAMVMALIPATVLADDGTTHNVSDSAELASAIGSAADGDTICIATGTYELGITTIDKNLTFIGASKDGVVINPSEDTLTDGSWFAVQSADSIEVSFSSISLNCDGKEIGYVLKSDGNSVTVNTEDMHISNVKHGQNNGCGFRVMNNASLNIKDVGMEHINLRGISIQGGEMTVDGFEYAGGDNPHDANCGIKMSGLYATTADIKNASFTDCPYGIDIDAPVGTSGYVNTEIEYTSFTSCETCIHAGISGSTTEYSATTVKNSNFIGSTDSDVTLMDKSGQSNASFTVKNCFFGSDSETEREPLKTEANSGQIEFIGDNAESPVVTPDTEITANADVTYMVVITPSVEFGRITKSMVTQTEDFIVAVEDALIEDGTSITVENTTVDMTMKDKEGTGSEELAFTLAQDAEPNNGVFTFEQADLTDGAEGIISSVSCEPSELVAAGSYKGYMTFEVSYDTE